MPADSNAAKDELIQQIRHEREELAAKGVGITEKLMRVAFRRGMPPDLREVIDDLVNRPALYVGEPLVEGLIHYVRGYLNALDSVDMDDGYFDGFQCFVESEYGEKGAANGKSWAILIREHAPDRGGEIAELQQLWARYKASRFDPSRREDSQKPSHQLHGPHSSNLTWHTGTVSRADRQRLLDQKGVALWLTGLSASGKSTIAVLLEKMLLERGRLAYRLDGDNVRHGLNKNLGFSAEDRAENIRRVGEVVKLFTDGGVIVIASFISPYQRDRDAVRMLMAKEDFVEVYVKVSVDVAEARDPKGLYKKARAGEIKGFTGIDDPYEPPEHPEIVIDTERVQPEAAAKQILAYLEASGHLRG